ncbi:hypothetical protein Ahy_B08g089060 [Arachis hypogaea]|uniref:Uncharacterized protein n=1 Tax=Arachis hypogaea TaxID=3818 RepID=A0A444XWK6_ARAHY|nr:hypothetical protein Ahy_B08g089060 [Arachis hypogaea]
MGEKNDWLVDVYFEHAVSTPEILEGNEIVVYVEGDHDDLREVSDEPDNEPLQDKIPNQTNIPTAPDDETPFTNNNEPTHNTSPPKSTEPTDPSSNNPTPQKYNPTTTSNSNPIQVTTAKPVSKTPPNRPQAPKKKKKTGPLTKNRRKDADEGNGGSKKSKILYTEGAHIEGCPKKRAADVAQALADAAAAVVAAKGKPNAQGNAIQAPTQAPPDAPAEAPPEAPSQAALEAPAQAPAPVETQVVEIDLSQPNYSDAQQSQHSQEDAPARPAKLQTRRRSSTPPSGSVTMDLLQGASSATSFRLANFLKFVPTPGFKPPRKKK